MKNQKNLKPKNEAKIRNKKRIVVDDNIKQLIKKRIKQGYNSKIIAEETGLPIGVIKRHYKTKPFRMAQVKNCIACGKTISKGVTCIQCKSKSDKISDDGTYITTEESPSEMDYGIVLNPAIPFNFTNKNKG